MSIFDIFKEKKTADKNIFKKKPGKKIREKKPLTKKEIVFESSKEVERFYRSEKEKAREVLKNVEKQRAKSLLEIAKKQIAKVQNEKEKIHLLHKDLNNHIKDIIFKIREAGLEKKNNKENIEIVRQLKKSLLKLERESVSIVIIRKELLFKEKNLVDKMNKITNISEGKLKLTDEPEVKKLIEIEKEKENLIEGAKKLLSKEEFEMFLDSKTLDSIGRIAKTKISKINKQLKELKLERVEIIKRRQLLSVSEENADKQLKDYEKSHGKLKKKFRRILGMK